MMYGLIRETVPQLSVKEKCRLSGVARSGYYRNLQNKLVVDDPYEMKLRDSIQQICLEMPRYGYRRVTQALHRKDYHTNHKRVLRLMRKDNLLCLRKKKRWFFTTDSSHAYRIYPNLVQTMTVTRPNQLWVADITYIRLVREFVYLAVILDAFSRRGIGWALSRHIDTQLSLNALTQALTTRTILPGLVHHSDRGVQYAATEYTDLLKAHNITISMSRKGNPYDNAMAESFMKTLKHDEVVLNEYDSFEQANDNIIQFLESVYNTKRLHSALGYKPPIEFEQEYFNSQNINNHNTLTSTFIVPI